MAECKHRWVETDWGKPYREARTFMYHCVRCNQCRIARLIQEDAHAV